MDPNQQQPDWLPVDETANALRGSGHVFGFGPYCDTPFCTISTRIILFPWGAIDDDAPTVWEGIDTEGPAVWDPVDDTAASSWEDVDKRAPTVWSDIPQ